MYNVMDCSRFFFMIILNYNLNILYLKISFKKEVIIIVIEYITSIKQSTLTLNE